MELSSLNELDFNESGEWPFPIKVIAILLLCALVWGATYWFVIKEKQAELVTLEQKESQLRSTFEAKQVKASNLDAYKAQMKEIKISFASMLQQLPRKNEVADLLIDISRTGLINGLEFQLFKPGGERPVDFYAELPISMVITGSYHQLGEFASGIARLPRIVTLHDFSMKPIKGGEEQMTMTVTAKTYRYFDEDEE
ncbi:MAG: type 4a pilus biogenesis protein PilO [Gammaproteobacteria bacterium]|nr:type 4a pilus biogenesis protein PilO [Gammaproteobacteria bacterium]